MRFKDYIQSYIDKSNVETTPQKWLNGALKTSVLFALAGAVVGYTNQETLSGGTIGFFAAGFMTFSFFLFNLTYQSYKKAKDIEEVLPDALELVASGIRAGLPVKGAIESMARPEFGPLASEISKVFVEESVGYSFEEALLRSTNRVSSTLYQKTISTLVKSIQSGVNVDKIAESLSKNMSEVESIRKDIKSSTVTYTLFLSFAALFASPVLFSLSSFLVQSNIFTSQSAGGDSSALPVSFIQVFTSLPPINVLNNFFLVSIIIVSISTSIAIGIVSKGSYKEGVKISPFFVIFALVVFYISKYLVSGLFGV